MARPSKLFVILDGERMALTDARKRAGSPLDYETIRSRILRGWPLKAALTRSANYHRSKLSRAQEIMALEGE